MSGRLPSILIALGVGISSGLYIFKPLLKQYEADTHGTFKPEDKDFKVDASVVEALADASASQAPSASPAATAATAATATTPGHPNSEIPRTAGVLAQAKEDKKLV